MALDRNARNWLVRLGFITLTCLCLLLIQSPFALAQVDMGSVTGTVSDTSGAVIPGAKVTLLNTDVGLTMEGISDSGGRYTFSPVKIGHYTLTATASGFSKTTQEAITVNVSQVLQVNLQLKPGAASETVTVSTAPPLLQTDQSSVGQVIDSQQVNGLPLNGRNFTFLAQLGAGTQTPQADTRGNAASGAFSANGLRPAQNNYLLDGIDNNSNAVDFLNGTNFVILPPVDAIQEFKVQTATFSAELGRSAGAVLNATIKSGTNSLHGAAWEFFRNDVLDAGDWFGNNQGLPKAKLNQNQFGASAGGPIIKNKIFFFGDYEGLQRVQGTTSTGTVPTNLMRSSGYTNFTELGVPIYDPATTRLGPGGKYIRDPFPGNIIPAERVDASAVNLLNLYPAPTTGDLSSNFASSPHLYQHSNAFDVRGDYNPNAKEQIFLRFSYVDNPQYIPGIFGGIADGGSFSQGIQTAKSDQVATAWTHVFTPTTINVARAGWNHLHTTRFGPEGNNLGLPDQYGIPGIPQVPENGGLPTFGVQGLANLGSNNFLPSDEVSQTLQITDDFTKIYGQHNFKMGIEYQHVKFSTLQPAWSRGQFDFNGSFTDVPGSSSHVSGIPQMVLLPEKSTVAGGLDYSGGSDDIRASNINKTYDAKNYFAAYFQDDWKVSPKLTLNLGLRYDYFGPIQETNGGQANFVPGGPPNGVPTYLIPASGKDNRTLSASFLSLLAKDGIKLESTNEYGQGLLKTQKYNFAPRVGFAYQVSPKFVTRGGFGFFFNSFENQGYGPNIGENYPFVYNFEYNVQVPSGSPDGFQQVAPVSYNTPYAGCPTAGPGGTGTFQSGFTCFSLSPEAVNAQGLGLQGLQFDYSTPRTLSANLTMQYSLTNSLSATASYVMTDGSSLQTGVGTNNVSQILPQSASTSDKVPFPDFGHGSSYQVTQGRSIYNGLQTKIEQQFAHNLTYLVAYTYSKTLSDAGDLLNGGSISGYRAPSVPGLGPSFDWALANFDIRNVFHASGSYLLPIGKDQKFMHDAGKFANAVFGGWSANWIYTLQGGQPITLGCPTGTTSGTNCYDIKVPGQDQKLGIKISTAAGSAGKPYWFGNPGAFTQPCKLVYTDKSNTTVAPDPASVAGCLPRTGAGALGETSSTTTGPGYNQLDLSAFKGFQISERFSMQFRAELFNVLNHPNFNAPGFGGNGVVAIGNSTNYTNSNFGQVGSTRSQSRQIQFALKLYY